MGEIHVRRFVGGLDARYRPETTPPGAFLRARNVHINSGGEAEKRQAFVEEYDLPAGTTGLADGGASLVVFGSGAEPGGLPSGVAYQRLRHEDMVTPLERVLSVDSYAGRLYVAAEFEDGEIFHFYDGERVETWFDQKARAQFQVVESGATGGARASGAFTVTAASGDGQVDDIKIDGVSIIAAPVQFSTPPEFVSNTLWMAILLAQAINGHTSSPNYTASVEPVTSGGRVIVIAADVGPDVNDETIVFTTSGTTVDIDDVVPMTGGSDPIDGTLTDIKVGGVSIIDTPIQWATSNEATAAAIAAEINSHASSPDYDAEADGAKVTIIAAVGGSDANGRQVTFSGSIVVSPTSATMTGGSSETIAPGRYVRTIAKKLYSTSGPNMHFSGIGMPTKFTTDALGAGFIDMSSEDGRSKLLTALEKYRSFVAVFAARVIQIWAIDPAPELYRPVQVLGNTGTELPRCIVQIGDADLLYVDRSGIRSLRARDSSNAAQPNDIGVPIDPLIVDALEALDDDGRFRACGVVEPQHGRAMLSIGDTIYVFSYFPGSKISAWTTYRPSVMVNGVETTIQVDDMIVFNDRVHIRSGDKIYVYGGLSGNVYDEVEADVWLPYLDAEHPTRAKKWTGIDAVVEGEWSAAYGMDPKAIDTEDDVAIVWETTYNDPDLPTIGESTHVSPRFRTRAAERARLCSVLIHYEGSLDDG